MEYEDEDPEIVPNSVSVNLVSCFVIRSLFSVVLKPSLTFEWCLFTTTDDDNKAKKQHVD